MTLIFPTLSFLEIGCVERTLDSIRRIHSPQHSNNLHRFFLKSTIDDGAHIFLFLWELHIKPGFNEETKEEGVVHVLSFVLSWSNSTVIFSFIKDCSKERDKEKDIHLERILAFGSCSRRYHSKKDKTAGTWAPVLTWPDIGPLPWVLSLFGPIVWQLPSPFIPT